MTHETKFGIGDKCVAVHDGSVHLVRAIILTAQRASYTVMRVKDGGGSTFDEASLAEYVEPKEAAAE